MNEPRQVVFSPINVEDADFEDYVDPKMAEENEEFEQFKSEMHDAQFDAKITVGKKMTDSGGRPIGRQTFECFECGIDDYTFSQLCTRIREDYGTGLYKISGRDSKGKYKFNKTVGILAPNQTDNAPVNDIGVLFDKFSDAMQRQQMQTERMFEKLTGPQTGGDAFDQMAKMATAMGGMMGAMGIQRPEVVPQKTMLEIMTEFKMMQELFGGDGGMGGGGGEANLYSLLTATMQSFGAPIAAALAAGQADGTVNAEGLLQAPKPNPQITSTQDQEIKKKAAETEALKGQIKMLIANAEAEADPKVMANLIVEKTPEANLDSLFDFLSSDDWFAEIVKLVPDATAHENWFTIMRDTVINLLTESDEPPIVARSGEPKVAGTDADTVADNTDSAISESTGDSSKNT